MLVGYRPHDQPASPRLQATWDTEGAALAAGDLDAAVTAGVQAWTSPDATGDIRAHAARMLHDQLTEQLAHGEPSLATDPLGQRAAGSRTLTTPALVGVGEHDMPDFFEGGGKLARDLDAGEITVISGAGHLAPLEQPTAFCALLLDFVRHLPEPSR